MYDLQQSMLTGRSLYHPRDARPTLRMLPGVGSVDLYFTYPAKHITTDGHDLDDLDDLSADDRDDLYDLYADDLDDIDDLSDVRKKLIRLLSID